MMFKVFNYNCPTYLRERFHRSSEVHNYNLRRSNNDLQLPLPKTNFLSAHSLIGVQWLGTKCQIKQVV